MRIWSVLAFDSVQSGATSDKTCIADGGCHDDDALGGKMLDYILKTKLGLYFFSLTAYSSVSRL